MSARVSIICSAYASEFVDDSNMRAMSRTSSASAFWELAAIPEAVDWPTPFKIEPDPVFNSVNFCPGARPLPRFVFGNWAPAFSGGVLTSLSEDVEPTDEGPGAGDPVPSSADATG
jgi:hypothetical protein